MAEELSLQYVTDVMSESAQTFLRLGKPYMVETDTGPVANHDGFLQSVLRRQGEADRWLALFIVAGEAVGFAHYKVDMHDRPGLGYILEFYVVPGLRRRGIGRSCASKILGILGGAGCPKVWLSSHPAAEVFWKSCGFRETGEFERNQKVLTADGPAGG